MKLTSVGDVIAVRKLSLSTDEGEKEITVVIGKPQQFEDGVNWFCPFQIQGAGRWARAHQVL